MVILKMRKWSLKEMKVLFYSPRTSGDRGKDPICAHTPDAASAPEKSTCSLLGNTAFVIANRVLTVKNNSFSIAVPRPLRDLWTWSPGAQLGPFGWERPAELSR